MTSIKKDMKICNTYIIIQDQYNKKIEDIQECLSLTHWSQKQIDKKTLNKVQEQLYPLNIIEKRVPFETIAK